MLSDRDSRTTFQLKFLEDNVRAVRDALNLARGTDWFQGDGTDAQISVCFLPTEDDCKISDDIFVEAQFAHLHVLPVTAVRVLAWIDRGDVEAGRVVLVEFNKYGTMKAPNATKWIGLSASEEGVARLEAQCPTLKDNTAEVVVFINQRYHGTGNPAAARAYHEYLREKGRMLQVRVLNRGMGALLDLCPDRVNAIFGTRYE